MSERTIELTTVAGEAFRRTEDALDAMPSGAMISLQLWRTTAQAEAKFGEILDALDDAAVPYDFRGAHRDPAGYDYQYMRLIVPYAYADQAGDIVKATVKDGNGSNVYIGKHRREYKPNPPPVPEKRNLLQRLFG